MDCATKALTLHVSDSIGDVDALLLVPEDTGWLLVLAHGAGAGMDHPFMENLARELSKRRVATFRYQFPYMQQRRKRPDSSAILTATVRAAVMAGSEAAPAVPLLAGGKSLGGRMTSLAFADGGAPAISGMARVRGLVFFGFPLHPAGRPGTQRAEHMARMRLPMLFCRARATRWQISSCCVRFTTRSALSPPCMWWTARITRSMFRSEPEEPTARCSVSLRAG